MTLPDRPFVRVTAPSEWAGMTGVLCGGIAGNWLVYLTCHGTYQTVAGITVLTGQTRVTGADMGPRREETAA